MHPSNLATDSPALSSGNTRIFSFVPERIARFAVTAICVGAWCLGACNLGGCSSTSSSQLTLPDFARGQAEADCTLYERCAGVRTSRWYGASCVDWHLSGVMNRTVPWWQDAIHDRTMVFHAGLAQRCLDELNARTCDDDFDLSNTACPDVFVGRVAAGGPCRLAEECAGDSFCDNRDGCPGICTPAIQLGEVCRVGSSCERGLFCDADRLCVASLARPIRLGDACDPDVGCGSQLMTCWPSDEAPGSVCAPTVVMDDLALGDPSCDQGRYCAEGLVCAWTGDQNYSNGPLGVRCERPYASGGPCHFAFPEGCPTGEYCAGLDEYNVDGFCTPLSTLGAACDPAWARPACAPGLRCFEGACATWRDNGAACVEDADCVSRHCEAGICAEPRCIMPWT